MGQVECCCQKAQTALPEQLPVQAVPAVSLPAKRRPSISAKECDSSEKNLGKHAVACEKTPADVELINVSLQEKLTCFKLLPEECQALAEKMQLHSFKSNECICREGEFGKYFFILRDGELEVRVRDSAVNTIKPGAPFGEIALVHNCPRTATVLAQQPSSVWAVDRISFRAVIEATESQNYEENRSFLNSVQFLTGLTPEQKNMVAQQAVLTQSFESNVQVVTKGDQGRSVYIIKSGELAVEVMGKDVARMHEGECFGERALMYGEKRSATVRTVSPSTLFCLDDERLRKVLGPDLDVLMLRNIVLQALRNSLVFSRFTLPQQQIIVECMEEWSIPRDTFIRKPFRFLVVVEGTVMVNEDKSATFATSPAGGYHSDGTPKRRPSLRDSLDTDSRDDCKNRFFSAQKVSGKMNTALLGRGKCFGDEYVTDLGKPINYCFRAGPKGARVHVLCPESLSAAFQRLGSAARGSAEAAMDRNGKVEAIRQIRAFRFLPQSQLRLLADTFQPKKCCQGSVIVNQGDSSVKHGLYYICEGEAQVSIDGKAVQTLSDKSIFGERALFFGDTHTGTLTVSKDDTELWSIDRSSFHHILSQRLIEFLASEILLQDPRNASLKTMSRDKVLGSGSFGIVKIVMQPATRARYSLQCVNRADLEDRSLKGQFHRHCAAWKEVDHPFMLHLVSVFQGKNWVYILTELSSGGLFHDVLHDSETPLKLAVESVKFYIGSIFLALEHLQVLNIVFRNVNPKSIMLDRQGYLQLSDFSLAKKVMARTYSTVGTLHYMAPEIIHGRGYGMGVDAWSLGVIFYQLLCGRLPFGQGVEDQLELCQLILAGNLRESEISSSAAAGLVTDLLKVDPGQRLNLDTQGSKTLRGSDFFKTSTGGSSFFDQLLSRSVDPPVVPQSEVFCCSPPAGGIDFHQDYDDDDGLDSEDV